MPLGKHFINDVEDPVERGLKCLLMLDQCLRLIESDKGNKTSRKYSCSLGSGHEPAHVGYLGEGMLDICVAGQIFASPSAPQVLAGLKALEAPHGILMIVKNYTGDKLNFGLAAQKAKAAGIRVNAVFVGDDLSVKGNGLVGRRGQQQWLPFESLEYGIGIHNEPGVRRDFIPSLQETVKNVIPYLLASNFTNGLSVAVMSNNLGGLSVLELNIIAGEVAGQLEGTGLDIKRMLVGTFVTSLNGPGFSVTVLKIQPGFEELLNAKTTAPAWPNVVEPYHGGVHGVVQRSIMVTPPSSPELTKDFLFPVDTLLVQNIIQSVVENVTRDEPQITRYDTIAGDGDCGETLLKGVKATQASFANITNSSTSMDLITTYKSIAIIVEISKGGTSGALYAIFFNALANSLSISSSSSAPSSSSYLLQTSLTHALSELCTYTSARKGHKTLMDALIPFVETFEQTGDFGRAVEAAKVGAEGTRRLDAVLGRASYVGKDALKEGVLDPGAMGVVSILKVVERCLDKA